MILTNEDDIKRHIKSHEFAGIYFIYGNESFLADHYTNLLTSAVVGKEFADFNFRKADGKQTTLDEISDCTSVYPMMGEHTCTLVTDYPLNSLVSDKGKINAEFDDIVKNLPETSVLVFKAGSVEIDEKNSKWNKIIKYIDSAGVCIKTDKRTGAALIKVLTDSAPKKGCTVSKDSALYMINLVGDDMNTLKNELDKVCAYKGSGEITRADIDKTVISSVEAKIFSLSRHITAGDADKAFETLSNLFKLREEPVVILATLANAYIDMYRAKAIKETGAPPEKLAETFPSAYKGRTFKITNAARDGAQYSLERLGNALDALSQADHRLKSTGEDPATVLEELVLRLMRI